MDNLEVTKMANDDRDGVLMSPYQPGAAGTSQNGWSANVRTADEVIAEQQAKFDAASEQARSRERADSNALAGGQNNES